MDILLYESEIEFQLGNLYILNIKNLSLYLEERFCIKITGNHIDEYIQKIIDDDSDIKSIYTIIHKNNEYKDFYTHLLRKVNKFAIYMKNTFGILLGESIPLENYKDIEQINTEFYKLIDSLVEKQLEKFLDFISDKFIIIKYCDKKFILNTINI